MADSLRQIRSNDLSRVIRLGMKREYQLPKHNKNSISKKCHGLAIAAFISIFSYHLFAQQDPYSDSDPGQWYLEAIKHSTDDLSSDQTVIVAVIDTGIDFYHPDLDDKSIWRNPKEQPNGIDDDDNGYVDDLIGWNFIDGNNNPWDHAGHGTHVAGVIAANTNNGQGIAGINPNAKIMPLKSLNFVGRGRSIAIAESIYYAVNMGADIINLSLGGENTSEVERLAISWAREQGVLTIVASGNSGVNTDAFGPAGLEEAFTVGAVDQSLRHAAFSNWGQAIDVVAPGVDILSLRARHSDFALIAGQQDYESGDGFVGDENQYYLATGTSFAAPMVTAVASLLLAQDPSRTPDQLATILRETAMDLETPGIDQLTGYGLVDVQRALASGNISPIDAIIQSVGLAENAKGKPVIQMAGTASATDFKQYWIEIGSGEEPSSWKKMGKAVRDPVVQGVLVQLDIKPFRKAPVWVLKLVVESKDGRIRETRFVLRLG